METYFKIKIFTEWVMPISILLIILILLFVLGLMSTIRVRRINSYFTKRGYTRKILGVPSVGNGVFCGFVKETETEYIQVDDRDIKRMTLKEIKNKYS